MKMLADIVNDENWCRGAFARDELGNKLDSVLSTKAVSHCMLGWLYKRYELELGEQSREMKKATKRVYGICFRRYGRQVTDANDSLIKDASEVAAIFAEARV